MGESALGNRAGRFHSACLKTGLAGGERTGWCWKAKCQVGGGRSWSCTMFSTVLILFSIFINDGSASITSTAGDAGFGDIGNTEKDLDIIPKRKI